MNCFLNLNKIAVSGYGYSYGKTPPVIRALLIINIAVYVAMLLIKPLGVLIWNYFFLSFPGSEHFVATQFVTNMFVHFPDAAYADADGTLHFSFMSRHLVFNMIGLWLFGSMVERVWGQKRFLNFYLACGLGASVMHILFMYIEYNDLIFVHNFRELGKAGGASGAIYGVMVAAAYLFPNNKVNVYLLIPIKIKYLVILLIAVDLFMGLRGVGSGVAHWAHLGGALVGAIFCFGGRLKRWRK
jgi:membrane associated rhomboid family serine protease